MAAADPDCHLRDLRAAIGRGDFPSWTVQIQVMPFADAAGYRFNPFDLTKVWPHGDYPPIAIGKITLNRNPEPGTGNREPPHRRWRFPGRGVSQMPGSDRQRFLRYCGASTRCASRGRADHGQ